MQLQPVDPTEVIALGERGARIRPDGSGGSPGGGEIGSEEEGRG